jgi:predicted permease
MSMLLRNPGVTAAAVLVLALGIGANSAIFSAVYAVLLRPLPVKDVDRLVAIAMVSRKLNVTGAQPGFRVYATWKEHGRPFESVAAASPGTASLSIGGGEQTVRLWRVTASFFPTLGVSPVMGRNFLPGEDQPGSGRVALLSRRFWRGRFNGDPRILGTAVTIEGEPFAILGVLPEGFHVDGRPADVYVPMARSLNSREALQTDIYARLKPGVTIQQAQAELDAYSSRLDAGPLGWQAHLWPLRDFQVRDVRLSLWVLLGAVGLVLLMACANTATLLLARATARRNEIAIRAALGAGGGRLVRQLLTESSILALLGGACGLFVAAGCVRLVPLLHHERLPGLLEQVRVDSGVLAFTLVLSVLTGLLFGAAPAVAARRLDVFATLKEGGRSGNSAACRRGWDLLVITETALALVLAVGATLLVHTFFYLRDVAPGFRGDALLTARIVPPSNKFTSREQCIAYWRGTIGRIRAIPGVEAAAFGQMLPMTGENQVTSLAVEGHHFARPQDSPTMWLRNVERDYFRTLQIPLRTGRLFTERDDAAAPRVVIVNETFARRFWEGQDPVGKHLGGGDDPLSEIIGVVGDVRAENSTKAAPLEIYFHYLQVPPRRIALAVRADPRVYKDPLLLAPAVERAVAGFDKNQKVTNFAEMRQLISDRIAPKRLSAQLIAAFAGLALMLAAIGIYGLLSFSVAQRTQEIGLRLALGAQRSGVLKMVVGQAALLAATGVGIGVMIALGLTRIMRSLLYGVSATDLWIYAGASAALLSVAVAAAIVPAWRAASIDPLRALRQE